VSACGFPADRGTFQDVLDAATTTGERLSLRLARSAFSSVTRRHTSAATAAARVAPQTAGEYRVFSDSEAIPTNGGRPPQV
jgi:hypothetical protein